MNEQELKAEYGENTMQLEKLQEAGNKIVQRQHKIKQELAKLQEDHEKKS